MDDLDDNCALVQTDPVGDAYRTIRQVRRGESVAPHLLPECRIAVDELLAPDV